MYYQPKNILVTGGCGFIGSNFLHFLAQHHPDYLVVNVDNLGFAANRDNLSHLPEAFRYHFVAADIVDKQKILELLHQYEIDTIVHFAAESHVDRSITDPGLFVHSNVLGTYALLDAARIYWLEQKKWQDQQCLFYHVSTDEVYGSLGAQDPAFTEKTAYAPNSPYSASKAGSDHLVRAYHHTYGLPVVMGNCSNNYGPRQHGEKFIPTIIQACLTEQAIPIYGDGSNIRDWLFVLDHCAAIDYLIGHAVRGETYNIGGNQEKTNLDVVAAVTQLLDVLHPSALGSYSRLIHFVADRLGHDWRYAIDAAKLKQLGWQPQFDFNAGLKKTIEYYLGKI
jgi:dTDP-glucose 4,6-dehydratase